MSYVNFAKDQPVGGEEGRGCAASPRRGQTVTIECSVERIEQFWRDPEQGSVVLGDIFEVELRGPDRASTGAVMTVSADDVRRLLDSQDVAEQAEELDAALRNLGA